MVDNITMTDALTNQAQVSFDDEPLILVDSSDRELGNLPKDACHTGEGKLHRAFSIFILNSRGEVLIQQRSKHKKLWPLFWSNSCCSHPRRGEKIIDAVNRRLMQELGISSNLTRHYEFEYRAAYEDVGVEHELCTVFSGFSDDAITVNSNEIAAWQWLSVPRLSSLLAQEQDRFTPWLKLEWTQLTQNYPSALKV